MCYFVSDLAADYSISLKFCIEFKHTIPKVQDKEIKAQGYCVAYPTNGCKN